MSDEKSINVEFRLLMDGIESVIDSTLPRNQVRRIILDEIYDRFEGEIYRLGEDRFVGGPGKWHLFGRYVRTKPKEENK